MVSDTDLQCCVSSAGREWWSVELAADRLLFLLCSLGSLVNVCLKSENK